MPRTPLPLRSVPHAPLPRRALARELAELTARIAARERVVGPALREGVARALREREESSRGEAERAKLECAGNGRGTESSASGGSVQGVYG